MNMFYHWGGREWLIVYTRPPQQPVKPKVARINRMAADYWRARKEHAWLLRCEGLKLREIGLRLGTGAPQAQLLVLAFGRRMTRALRRTRWQLR